MGPDNRLFLWKQPPQWEDPDFWSEPYDDEQQECVDFYETPTYVYNERVPLTSLIQVRGVSYHWVEDLPVGDYFDVQLMRNHDTLCTWTDYVVSATGDKGGRFAMCSHFRPMEVNTTFDRGDHIHVRVTYHGPYPYAKNANDPLKLKCRVLLHGYKARISSTGDGQQAKGEGRRLPLGVAGPGRLTLKDEILRLARS
jgi:hypothetical protein